MKKIRNRIIALMLSVIMMFGFIPSNIASAVEPIDIVMTFGDECFATGDTVPSGNPLIGGIESVFSVNIFYKDELISAGSVDSSTFENAGTYCYFIQGEYLEEFDRIIFNGKTLEKKSESLSEYTFTSTTAEYYYDSSSKHLTIQYAFDVHDPISEVNLFTSGVLARNFRTKKYEVASNAPYTITDDGKWYKENLTDEYNFSTDEGLVYKKLILTPKSGYKFAQNGTYDVNGDFYSTKQTHKESDGTIHITVSDAIIANTTYLTFPTPTTYSDLIALQADFRGDKSKFDMKGAKEFKLVSVPIISNQFNGNESGVFVLCFTFIYNDKAERDSILNIYFNRIDGEALSQTRMASNIDDFYDKVKNDGLAYIQDAENDNRILLCYKVDLHKTATITCPTTAGTTVGDIKQSIVDSFATTNSVDTGSIAETSTHNKKIQIYDITNGLENAIELDEDADALENNKMYVVEIDIDDVEAPAYTSIKVNNTTLTYTEDDSDEQHNNHYRIDTDDDSLIYAFYKIDLRQSSGGSKKYDAKDKEDTVEKITGSGKKGSTRTIIPEPNRKVESIVVTDKNGNEVEVTKNEDGTFSFIQPASDVNVKVNYRKREITLNIGSTKAMVDGEESNLDVCPILRNDRTMLPIRFIAENLGATVTWDEKNPNYVLITRGDTKIEIILESDIMLVNNKEVKLDQVAFAENDRTYLPVRAISEALNAVVEWDESKPSIVKIYER